MGRDSFIRGETNMPIAHALIVRQNVKLEDIEHVLSHEQVATRIFLCIWHRLTCHTGVRAVQGVPEAISSKSIPYPDRLNCGRCSCIA